MTKKSLGNKYAPTYAGDYFSRPWYEKDLMNYFEYLDYQDMAKEPKDYFKNRKVISSDKIHHELRGDPLEVSYKNYQSIKTKDLQQYPPLEKKTVSGIIHNIKCKDMFFEKNIIKEHFLN